MCVTLVDKYSSAKFVGFDVSIVEIVDKSSNITLIIISFISLFPSSFAFLLISSLSSLIIYLFSLKKISKASNIVDFPISFFPTNIFKSLKFIITFYL